MFSGLWIDQNEVRPLARLPSVSTTTSETTTRRVPQEAVPRLDLPRGGRVPLRRGDRDRMPNAMPITPLVTRLVKVLIRAGRVRSTT